MRKIVYASGVTGVGKTTLIKQFVKENPNWIRVSGGDMIMKARGYLPEAERDKLREMTGFQARQNQLLMLKSFRETLAETDKNIVFDGQCLVRAYDGKLRPIPASIAVRMGISKVIFLSESPEIIKRRRRNDMERPNREDETYLEITERQAISEEICRR